MTDEGVKMKRSYINWAADVQLQFTWPLFSLSLLWCLGFAGASAVAIAVVLLAQSHAALLTVAPWAIAGAALAGFAWRRAVAVLETTDEARYQSGAGD
jgi:hypothetical protein